MTARRVHALGALCAAALAACSPTRRTTPTATAPMPAAEPTPQAPVVDAAAAVKAGDSAAAVVVRRADSLRVSMSDVTRGARGVFGDSVTPDRARSGDDPDDDSSSDLDVESYVSQDRVEHFVRMFSGSARARIEERLSVGTRYEPMIRQRMREGGLPEDMYYLALVESGFEPHAYSRAAAVGMWQFMTSTGRDMGLRIDWWVDERRDPVRSTRAAVRFIRGLRDQFGSLYLAAAAYNGGPGRVARGLAQFKEELEGQEGEDVFFALAEQDWLRKETKDYVPQLIAAAIVANDPERYGMSVKKLPPFAYDSARVGPESALPAIARAAGVSVAALQDLNPQLLRGVTPPRGDWTLRLPVGTATRFSATWASMPREERVGLHRVETRKGRTLEAIAEDAGISYRQLVAYNPGIKRTKKGRVLPGQTLVVPTPAVVAAALVVPDPEIERYGSAAKRSTRSSRSRVAFHVVRRGETLGGIARKYGTTVARLQKLNRLRKPIIFPGQSLVVRGEAASERSASKSGRTSSVRIVQSGRRAESPAARDRAAEKTPARVVSGSGRSSKAASSRTTSAKARTAKGKSASKSKKPTSARASAAATKSRSSTRSSAAKKGSSARAAKPGAGSAKKKSAAPKDGARKGTRRAD